MARTLPDLPISLRLSRAEARALMLDGLGLLRAAPPEASKADLLNAIRTLSLLQIDTISVVARSPYLVLFSRVGPFREAWLTDLLAEGALFEYWAHEACFIPREDYPLYRRLMLEGKGRRSWSFLRRWEAEHQSELAALRTALRERGPLRSADFARQSGPSSGWWDWKAEKIGLELLFATGEVMIARRERFQRLYDLRERVRPDWHDTEAPPLDQVYEAFVERTLRHLGVSPLRWIADYFRRSSADTAAALGRLIAKGHVLAAEIEGEAEPWYALRTDEPRLRAAQRGELQAEQTRLLSPFDPLVWDRRRASELFGFDYRIECYTPAAKRQYGYFSLPILHRGHLVGRLDPKAHRQAKVFEIKALHLEPGFAPNQRFIEEFATALRSLAAWHNCAEIRISAPQEPDLTSMLRSIL